MRQIWRFALVMAFACIGFAAPASPLAAQLAAPAGLRARELQPVGWPRPLADTARSQSRLPVRFGLGLLGGIAGLLGGAILAAELELGLDCECDDPGLGHAVTGGIVGAALGAALLAALPETTTDRCRYSARLWRALGTAALGVGAGFLAPVDARVVTVPLGGIVGAAFGAESCVWQRHN